MASNEPFPIGATSLRVRLPTTPRPMDHMLPRGVEGLRPGIVIFPKVKIERTPNDALQPIAAVFVADEATPTAPTEGVSLIDALDRCSWTLAKVVSTIPDFNLPFQFDYEIRGALTGVSETTFTGSSDITTIDDNGLLVQVSGYLCSQWEFWARLTPSDEAPVGTTMSVRLMVAADRIGGPFATKKGSRTS